ncbi:MAG: acetyl-CoA carboxylase biotin carboxyl carrier protein [Azospirillum brasilense]|nr:MAG: acetyl-CoA carboxylase biotin carboxyl carrier protein [Azospirillum brasilense]
MDIDEIKTLIRLVSEAPIAELEYREGETSVRIVKRGAAPAGETLPPAAEAAADPAPDVAGGASPVGVDGAETTLHRCAAPLPGLFYRRAGPAEPPFVEVGAAVATGQTLGLIEAMKMLTPVKAPADGVVLRILAENGAMVDEGTPLFEIG